MILKNFTLISGATGGLGRAFAFECAKEGNLFLTGRGEDKLARLRRELEEAFPQISVDTFACDLTDFTARRNLFGYISGKGYTFARLCNVAGADIQKPFEKYTQEKLTFQCRINFEAAVSLTRFLLDRREPCFEVVTIGSISGVYPMPYFALYSAAKSALTSFFSSLRAELKGCGVKVTTVEPGGIYTRPDVIEYIRGQGLWGKLSAKRPEYVAKKSLRAVRRNKRLIRPGFWNKFIAVAPRILPLGLRMRFIARRWEKIEKDAF